MFGIKFVADAKEMVLSIEQQMKDAADAGEFGKMYDLSLERGHYQGVLDVYTVYENNAARMDERIAEGKANEMQKLFVLQNALTKVLARGADDQWSGSGNELQRAIHRGKCAAADELQYNLMTAAEKLAGL